MGRTHDSVSSGLEPSPGPVAYAFAIDPFFILVFIFIILGRMHKTAKAEKKAAEKSASAKRDLTWWRDQARKDIENIKRTRNEGQQPHGMPAKGDSTALDWESSVCPPQPKAVLEEEPELASQFIEKESMRQAQLREELERICEQKKQNTQRHKTTSAEPIPDTTTRTSTAHADLRDPKRLREIFLYKEILDSPVSLKEHFHA